MEYKESVFPIIGKLKSDTQKYIILATGFFIDNNGFFITAGHTFRKNINTIETYYISIINNQNKNELLPILAFNWISKNIYGEIERKDNVNRDRNNFQCGPEYMDVAVGKVKIHNKYYFELLKKRPQEWHKLISLCYNRNKKTCTESGFYLNSNFIYSNYLEFNEKPLKLKNRMQFARVFFMGNTFQYENIDLFNNCVELEGDIVKGNSGAPVINENNKVIGIILGGEKFSPIIVHLSRYVLKKAKRLKRSIEKSQD